MGLVLQGRRCRKLGPSLLWGDSLPLRSLRLGNSVWEFMLCNLSVFRQSAFIFCLVAIADGKESHCFE